MQPGRRALKWGCLAQPDNREELLLAIPIVGLRKMSRCNPLIGKAMAMW